ncbi:hypothetical protein [Bacteroides sp.]
MKKRTSLIVLLLFIFHFSYSANIEWLNGYIVTNESDTIRGQLAFRDGEGDWKECIFRQSEKDVSKVYSPEQISAYGYDSGLFFISIDVKLFKIKQCLFLQSLLLGRMDLYYLDIKKCTEFPDGYAAYIVRTPSGEMMELSDPSKSDNRNVAKHQNRAKLNYLFSDYPTLQESITRIDSNREQWVALFQKYHDIIHNEYTCTFYKETTVSSHWFLTPYLVGNYHKAGFNNFANHNSFMPGAGLVVTRSLSKYTDRNLFHIGLEFSGVSISTHDELGMMDFSTLSAINYYTYENRFVHSKVAPLLEIGLYHGMQFALKNKFERKDEINKVNYSKYYCGLLLGTGMAFRVKSNWIPVKLQYRYMFWGSKPMNDISLERVSGFSLSVEYTFKL